MGRFSMGRYLAWVTDVEVDSGVESEEVVKQCASKFNVDFNDYVNMDNELEYAERVDDASIVDSIMNTNQV